MRAIAQARMYDSAAHQVDYRNHFTGTVGERVVRIHVFEFICGGGMTGLPLPEGLAREGDLMMSALVGDLLEVPGVEVSVARDARLAPPANLRGASIRWRAPGEDARTAFEREIDTADAIWPIAPETDGELERCARAVLEANRILFGPRPQAIAVSASKSATAQRLARAGIDTVPCFVRGSAWDATEGPWVLKPDDGAGCCGMRLFPDRESAAAAWSRDEGRNLVAQPWIDGEAMSLCVLAGANRVDVLSVNRQLLRSIATAVEVGAIEVNCEAVGAPLQALAERVAAAVPGLKGFFGIDFVRSPRGPIVVEINPRLTSSYAGLRAALGLNVAERVLAAETGTTLAPIGTHTGRCVTLRWKADALE